MTTWLRAAEPSRRFHVPTLRTLLQKLMDRGMIRRVSKGNNGCVQWAAIGAVVPESPFGAMSLTDVAEVVLRKTGPLRTVKLLMTIQHPGNDDGRPSSFNDLGQLAFTNGAGGFVSNVAAIPEPSALPMACVLSMVFVTQARQPRNHEVTTRRGSRLQLRIDQPTNFPSDCSRSIPASTPPT
jgi:hypothetical protein